MKDFSELIRAVQEGDDELANELLSDLTRVLISYLQTRKGASYDDAADCAQQTILLTYEAIKEDRIEDADRIFSYLMTTCKNNYYKLRENRKEYHYDRLPENPKIGPLQINRLYEQERKRILNECINSLKDDYREFIKYWFQNPDSDATEVAKHFNISVNNAWVRKHRVIKMLQECYLKKINL